MRRLESLAAESATLQAYLQEIAKFPRLASDEERELGRRIRQQQDVDARAALVEANLRFVVAYARRFRWLGVPLLALIHEGNLGLIEAARHFDPERHGTFIAAAMWWVRQSMMHRLADAQPAALRAQIDHLAALGSDALLEISEDEVQALLHGRHDDGALHLLVATSSGGDDDGFDDALQEQAIREVDDDQTREVLVREFELALTELDAKERLVMRLRYGLHDDEPWTLEQIAERLRVTGERVHRLELRAVQTLRRLQHLRSGLN